MKTFTVKLAHDAPELAVLEILDTTLDIVTTVLMAAHPFLHCEPPPWWRKPPRSSLSAQHIVKLADQLRDALADYQRAVDVELADRPDDIPAANDDIPF
jgi:hypothetical protein